MNEHRRRSDLKQAKAAYRQSGTGISLLIRDLYSCVQQSSIECGFDAEQVKIIWRTASQAYSAGEISLAFEGIFKELHSNHVNKADYRAGTLPLPIDALEGAGSVAIRALAHLKAQHDAKLGIWFHDAGICEFRLIRPAIPWANFTHALLDKLVKDELLTNSFRCKLFARDLGL
ncbi:hypothetical protein DT385_03645 [Pseudomonas syringae]|nr:hypothetical protein EOL67_13525 [Pseudomonas syringae pv. syringae]TRN88991.1 hypothetical protein DT385_03645 [Pseudomonas syringae]